MFSDNPPETPVCALCGGPTSEDDYCYGCDAYICEKCDMSGVYGFGHRPEDHRKTTE